MAKKFALGKIPQELLDIFPYFLCAYAFGWDKEQVDRQEAEYIEKLLVCLQLMFEQGDSAKSLDGLPMGMGGGAPNVPTNMPSRTPRMPPIHRPVRRH